MTTTPHENALPRQDHDWLMIKPQVAERLSISVRSMDNLIRSGAISFVRIGRSVRFEHSAVEAFKNSRRVNAI